MISFDPKKATVNFAKHGVHLADAEPALYDQNGRTVEDWSEGEQRFNTLGMDATGTLVIVTWTDRGEEQRIISSRKASSGEAKHYGK